MNTKRIVLRSALSMAIMLSAVVLFSQPSGGGGGQGTGGSPPATGAPIDGGATLLLAGIAGYAHRKLRSGTKVK